MKAAFVLLAASALAQEKPFPLRAVRVEGAERYDAARVAAASGLKAGQPVTIADFEKASQGLVATGFFTSVNFRYAPLQGGYELTLLVVENGPPSPVALDVPGVDEAALWKSLLAADPLAAREIPLDDAARARMAGALERIVSGKIASKLESDLSTGRYEIVFRPAEPARVRTFRLAGNQAVDAATAIAALERTLTGAEFTPRTVRHILELNLTPIYEERGYLRVVYSDFALDAAGALTIAVREGATYRLGEVELAGDRIPMKEMTAAAAFRAGELANWHAVMESAGRAAGVLKRDGYVAATHEIERRFREKERAVDLTVLYRRGPRYSFGKLVVAGLPFLVEAEARALWTLASGAPFNPDYADEWLKKVLALPSVAKLRATRVAREMLPAGPTELDLKITFR